MAVLSLSDQLKQIRLDKTKLATGENIKDIMVREAKLLYRCIQAQIDLYYNSYEPTVYKRTGNLKRALYAQDLADIRIVGNTLRISVGFHNNLAYENNLDGVYWNDGHGNDTWFPIYGKHHSYVPVLMEFGWHSRRLAAMIGQDVYRLTYFEGTGMIQRGIDFYNSINTMGIHVVGDGILNVKAY